MLWLELLIFLIALMPIEMLWFVVKKNTTADIFFIKLMLRLKPTKTLKYAYLERKLGILNQQKVNFSRFHEINKTKHDYMPFIIKTVANDSKLLEQMPPQIKHLMKVSKSRDFDFDSLQKIYGYYREPPIYLAYRQGKGEKIHSYELERLIYESNLQERLLLENNLPSTHPLLHEINEQQKIPVSHGYMIIK